MNFDSPARKKKRRSSFFDKQTFVNSPSILESTSTIPGNQEINKYIEKLKKEKQEWINYEKSLSQEYASLKQSLASGALVPKSDDWLKYLPKEDTDYLEAMEKLKEECIDLCKNLPKINETLHLFSYAFNDQVLLGKLMSGNYKKCIYKLRELVYTHSFENNFEPLAPKLTNLYDESTIVDEPFLYIDGV